MKRDKSIRKHVYTDRDWCTECGEDFNLKEEWKYNTHCGVCGHPIPKNKIVKKTDHIVTPSEFTEESNRITFGEFDWFLSYKNQVVTKNGNVSYNFNVITDNSMQFNYVTDTRGNLLTI